MTDELTFTGDDGTVYMLFPALTGDDIDSSCQGCYFYRKNWGCWIDKKYPNLDYGDNDTKPCIVDGKEYTMFK